MLAVVTGASSGIGKEMAYYLSELGYDLILVARRKENLEQIKRDLKTKVDILPFDLSVENEVYNFFNKIKSKKIDLFINNAGFGLFGTFDKTNLDSEINMIDLNVKAVHILTKLVLIKFIKNDHGIILNTCSSAGLLIGGPNLNTYYATKSYLVSLTSSIYQELKEMNSNVHISALCPGPTLTEFMEVADGKFKTKLCTPTFVARYGIDNALKHKLIIVPGFKYKIGLFITRFLPKKIILKFISSFQKKKKQ